MARLLIKTAGIAKTEKALAAFAHHLKPGPSMGPLHAAGQFDFPVQQVGKSKWTGSDGGGVTVYYDPALGAPGLAVAQSVLARIDDLMAYCDWAFNVRGKAGNVIVAAVNGVTDGTGGAYHYGCSFGAGQQGGSDWYEDMASNADETFGLVMAEVCESYMGLQGKGWNCGGSGGEGLSRFLAEIVSGGSGGALWAFRSGPSWDGTDWISRDQGTDGDYPSIGCSILYCWWMTSLGYTVDKIVQAGEPDGTLASNYAALTGKPASQAFADFKAAVAIVGNQDDNPWKVPTPPYPLPVTHVCPSGEHWDAALGKCVPDVPPQTCPAGQHWDASLGKCVPDTVPSGKTAADYQAGADAALAALAARNPRWPCRNSWPKIKSVVDKGILSVGINTESLFTDDELSLPE